MARGFIVRRIIWGCQTDTEITPLGNGTVLIPNEISKWETTALTIMDEHVLRENITPWENNRALCGPEVWTDRLRYSANGREENKPFVDMVLLEETLRSFPSFRKWIVVARVLPLGMVVGFPVWLIVSFLLDCTWVPFTAMTAYFCYNCWKHVMHVAIFSNVGCMKVEAYQKVDFESLFEKLASRPGTPECAAPIPFREVLHVVFVPNYKEDLPILREAIGSIADSNTAKHQIAVILAMEEREQQSPEKAEVLIQEFQSKFWHISASFHPAGIPGEQPGKSSNTRWAAKYFYEELQPKWDVALGKVILTVADADSDFHPQYFAALTHAFLAVAQASRYNTIWQAPILHYKNYHAQPAVVRLCSLLTSQHELANLADPAAARLPYSTYSLSAVLAKAVDGWDPEYISEDWHMCLKCFFSTIGSLNIQPIFLPILNYTPEGETWFDSLRERFTQAKRHALGVSEVVYAASIAPYVIATKSFPLSRRLLLSFKGVFLWGTMTMTHVVMATIPVVSAINAYMCLYFYRSGLMDYVNSWTFLANCVFQFFGSSGLFLMVYTNVRLYYVVHPRIVAASTTAMKNVWDRPIVHFFRVFVESVVWAPFFFMMGASAEWIAAAKTSKTHRFEYDVASKPQLGGDRHVGA